MTIFLKLTFDETRDCGEQHVTQDILVESCREGVILINQFDGNGEGPYCIAVAPKNYDALIEALYKARFEGVDTLINTETEAVTRRPE